MIRKASGASGAMRTQGVGMPDERTARRLTTIEGLNQNCLPAAYLPIGANFATIALAVRNPSTAALTIPPA
jgi:hypothetical protein